MCASAGGRVVSRDATRASRRCGVCVSSVHRGGHHHALPVHQALSRGRVMIADRSRRVSSFVLRGSTSSSRLVICCLSLCSKFEVQGSRFEVWILILNF